MKCVAVIGTTGSGKTTFAATLASRLGVPHIELDALHWDSNWTPAPTEVFRARVEAAIACASWVADGNYNAVRDLVWGRADTLVWLDYSLPLILYRLALRTFGRAMRNQELWNGNREQLRMHFLSRNSLFLWALKTHGRRRREYPALFSAPQFAHLHVIRLQSPHTADAWLQAVVPV